MDLIKRLIPRPERIHRLVVIDAHAGAHWQPVSVLTPGVASCGPPGRHHGWCEHEQTAHVPHDVVAMLTRGVLPRPWPAWCESLLHVRKGCYASAQNAATSCGSHPRKRSEL